MRINRARICKVLVVGLVSTLFFGGVAAESARAGYPITSADIVNSPTDIPSFAPVAALAPGMAYGVLTNVRFCLAYYNDGYASSNLGPASNALTPYTGMGEFVLTFPAPPAGKSYLIYSCVGTNYLISETPVTGTTFRIGSMSLNAGGTGLGRTFGLPQGSLVSWTTMTMPGINGMTNQIMVNAADSLGLNQKKDSCFTDAELMVNRANPLVDGQSISFTIANRNIADFYPAGTPGSGTTTTQSFQVSGGKVCASYVGLSKGSTSLSPVIGQTFQTRASDPSAALPVTYVANSCVTASNMPNPTTGAVTCTTLASKVQPVTITVNATLIATPKSQTLAPSGTGNISVTSPDSPIPNGEVLQIQFAGGVNVLDPSMTNFQWNFPAASGGTATFPVTVGSTMGTGNYLIRSTVGGYAALPVQISVGVDAPTSVTAKANDPTSATISFAGVTPPAGSTISGYTVTAYDNSGTAISPAITNTGTASPLTITGLTAGSTYTFKVAAISNGVTGVFSKVSNSLVMPAANRLPGAPGTPVVTLISASATNLSSDFSIDFTPSSDLGEPKLTSYTAQLYIDNVATAIKVSGTSSPITVSLPVGNPTSGSYTFKVFATNSVGDGPSSAASNATAVTIPAAPDATAMSTAAGQTSFDVTPAPVSGAIAYDVFVYPAGTTAATGTPLGKCTVKAPATFCQVNGNPTALTSSTSYVIFTRATNAFATGPWSAATTVTTELNPATLSSFTDPSYYTATPGILSINVSWPAASNLPTGYEVHVQEYFDTPLPNGDGGADYFFNTSTNSISIPGLSSNSRYLFDIVAIKNGVKSSSVTTPPAGFVMGVNTEISNPAANTFIRPYGPPIAPAISGITGTYNSATIDFTPLTVNVANTSGFAVTSYTVTALINGVETNLTATGISSPLTITGLTPGVTYQFDVRATTDAGTSPLNLSSNYTPVMPPAPPAPTSVTAATGNTSGTVNIGFTAPTAPAGTSITGFTFTAIPSSGSPIVVTVPIGSVTNPYPFANLARGSGSYTFTVAATSVAGTGPASIASASYTMPSIPSAPTLVSTDLAFNNASGHVTFAASSSDGGAAITKYRIRLYPTPTSGYGVANPSQVVEITETSTAGTAAVTLQNHSSNPWYQYETITVSAVNMVGESPESLPIPLIPGQPGTASVVGLGDGQITLQPAIPAAAAYPTSLSVTAYDMDDAGQSAALVFARSDNSLSTSTSEAAYLIANSKSTSSSSCIVTLPQLTCTISGLTNGHHYDFIVRSFNSTGGSKLGGWRYPSTGVVPVSAAMLAPTNVNAVAGNTRASVWWDLPLAGAVPDTTTISTPIYTITAYANTGETLSFTTSTLGTASVPYIFTGLTNGKTYTFVVSDSVTATSLGSGGISGNFVSAGSAPSNAVTPATVPSKPSTPSVSYSGNTATITYSAPANNGSAITSYTFVATPIGGGSAITQTTANLSSPYTFTNLNLNTSYIFKMSATNAMGDSIYSDTATAATSILVVRPSPVTVPFGTAYVGYTPTYKVAGSIIDPTLNNSGFMAPTCTSTPTYSSTLAASVYASAITCSGGTAGSLYSSFTYQADTLTVSSTAPIPPSGVSATFGNGQATVGFNTSPGATSYTVTAYVNGIATSIQATGTTSPITVAGLTPGVNYSFVVTASSGTGTSLGSIPTVSTVMPKTTLYIIPKSLTVTQGSPSVTYLSELYVTAYDTSTIISNGSTGNVGWATPSCKITPAYTQNTAAGLYDIACSGGNGGSLYTLDYGYTAKLNVAASFTIPSAPTNVMVTASGATGATVAFTAPSIATPALSTYTVTAIPVGGGTPVVTTVSGSATSAAISGLNPGTTYNFQVIANNTGGSSTPGSASLKIAPLPGGGGGSGGGGYVAAPVVIPTAPTGVIATIGGSTGSNYAIVSFNAAPTNGVTTSYTVTAQPGGITASGTGSPIRIDGLTPGVSYTFTVSATNSAGTSSSSTGSPAFVIPSVPVVNPLTSVPNSVAVGAVPVLLNGIGQNVSITRNLLNGTLNLSTNDWSLKVSAYGETGRVNPPTASLQLVGYQGGNVGAEGTGFASDSAVAVYMFSKTYTLGTHTTDGKGVFNVVDAIPSEIPVGEHVVQIVGYAPDGKVRSASIKITIKAAAPSPTPTKAPEVVPTPTPTSAGAGLPIHSATTKVFFNLNEYFVSAKARATMKKFIAAVQKHKGPYKVYVLGMVEPTPVNPLPVELLAKARATSVAKLLREYGLFGKYSIRGGGYETIKGPAARYTKITVTWQE